jgi:nitrogen fixation protein NifU and related proteins
MSNLKQLYQEIILDHNKNPRNFGPISKATHKAEGYNPLCGDRYTLYLQVQDDKVVDVGFDGAGCAISKSSASLMTSCLKGSSMEEAQQLFDNFHRMLTEEIDPSELTGKTCKIAALQGVKAYPTRIKCATLVWHTMKSALEGEPHSSTD